MEETTPTFIQEYFGEYGIMGSIIVILLFIIGFLYLRQKYPKMTLTKEAPEETPAEEPEPEPLLIHCPACGTEVSRYAPACLKCPTGEERRPRRLFMVFIGTNRANSGFYLL